MKKSQVIVDGAVQQCKDEATIQVSVLLCTSIQRNCLLEIPVPLQWQWKFAKFSRVLNEDGVKTTLDNVKNSIMNFKQGSPPV